MSTLKNIGRGSEIANLAVQHGFGYVFERMGFTGETDDLNGSISPTTRAARHLRSLLEELGPTFIKFGQMLSVRPDLVPPEVLTELTGLQNRVATFPFEEAKETIERDLGLTLERLFVRFTKEPLGAASIGQVHRATLPGGQEVVVKVRRPKAAEQIHSDMDLLRSLAHFLVQRNPDWLFIDPEDLIEEFSRSLEREINYRLEAREMEKFYKNFAGDPRVVIPRVYRDYSSDEVLTMDFLDGPLLAELDFTRMPLFRRRMLIEQGTDIWLTQIFDHRFFHADPHPSNVVILPGDRFGIIDFGIVGELSREDLDNLVSLVIALSNRDLDRLPSYLRHLGVHMPSEKNEAFKAEMTLLIDRYGGLPLDQINAQKALTDFFSMVHRLNIRLPTRWVLFEKALITLEAVGKDIYPKFNVFGPMKPYAQRLVVRRYSPGHIFNASARNLRRLGGVFSDYPYQIHTFLDELKGGRLRINFHHRGLEEMMHQLDRLGNRIALSLVISALLISSSLIGLFVKDGPMLLGISIVSLLGFGITAAIGLWLIISIIRSGRI